MSFNPFNCEKSPLRISHYNLKNNQTEIITLGILQGLRNIGIKPVEC